MIYIPSAGRTDTPLPVLRDISPRWLRRTVLAVPAYEVAAYRQACRAALGQGVSILSVPDRIVNIADTRQYIMDTSLERYVFYFSDDVRFYVRKARGNISLRDQTPRDFDRMMRLMIRWLRRGFVHVGVIQRQLEHTAPEIDWCDVGRMNDVYGYCKPALVKTGCRFDRMQLMSDYDMTLQLLRKGCANRVSYHYCWNQYGSNYRGGCSRYRNRLVLARWARQLRRFHPQFVKIIQKQTKTWKKMHARTDVRIQWRKAFKDLCID